MDHEQESVIKPVDVGHEDEHHHNKKSMLGKVKEKAKKVKNTLKKPSHRHNHDDQRSSPDEDDDNNDDNDQAEEEDPEIHQAPTYDSATVPATQAPRTTELDSRGRPDDKHASLPTGVHNEPNNPSRSSGANDSYTGLLGNVQGRGGNQTENLGNVGGRGENLGGLGAGIGKSIDKEEDTNAPGKDQIFDAPSNYNTKVADSTGTGKETGITPILHSLDKMGISDEPQNKPSLETNQNYGSTNRSHDQSSSGIFDELHNVLGTKQNLGSSTGSHEPRNKPILGTNHNLGSTTGSQSQFSPGINDEPRNSQNLGPKQNLGHDQLSPGIYDEPRNNPDLGTNQNLGKTTGSHDRFSPEPTSTDASTMKSSDLPDHISENRSSEQSSYTGMISSAASSVANKAVSAKNAVASTIGYGGPNTKNQMSTNTSTTKSSDSKKLDPHHVSENPSSPKQSSNTGMISSAASSIANKAVSAKNAVASTIGFGGPDTKNQMSTNTSTTKSSDSKNSTPDPHHVSENLSSPKQSSNTGMISSAASSVANKAVSSKNVVASTIGYGGPDTKNQMSTNTSTTKSSDSKNSPDPHHVSENPSSPKQSSYTGMISSAASSVANKAVSTKNAVASTIGYGGPDTGKRTSDSSEGVGLDTTNPSPGGSENVARGASSVKKYWIEKLRPGKEDKALSEVISGAISTNPSGKGVSDAVHERAPEETKTERVKVSKDVAEQLGMEGEKDSGEGIGGAGKGMVDTIRGTVSSWMGKENPQQSSQGNAGGGEAAHGRAEDDHAKTTVKDY